MSIVKNIGVKRVSYTVRLDFGPDPISGERRQRQETVRTRKEAESLEAKWRTQIDTGVAVDIHKMTVAELFAHWLDVLRGTNPKERTISEYERIINGRILPVLGATLVQKVNPAMIDAFYAGLRAGGASDDGVHRCHKRLRQVFDYAVRKRLVVVNPMLAVDGPTVRSQPPTILSVSQMQRFMLFAANDGYSPLWLLILQTGMRRGEALGVRWSDIDWQRGNVQVRQCVEALNGKPHITTPKTRAALRTITLFAESIAALKAHKAAQNAERLQAGSEWRDLDLVFTTPNGGPLDPSHVLRNLGVIRRKANAPENDQPVPSDQVLPRFDIHDLRHTHATHLLTEGWPVHVVSRRLGHANPAITMSIYAHALTDTHGDDMQTPVAFAFKGTA